MRKIAGRFPALSGVAGLAAVLAIVGFSLARSEGLRPLEILGLACGAVASCALVAAALDPRRALGLAIEHDSGEALSLQAQGLSAREREFVLEMLAGKSMKEISVDHGTRYSTVRNILSSSYRKLGVAGRAELMVLGERYRVE